MAKADGLGEKGQQSPTGRRTFQVDSKTQKKQKKTRGDVTPSNLSAAVCVQCSHESTMNQDHGDLLLFAVARSPEKYDNQRQRGGDLLPRGSHMSLLFMRIARATKSLLLALFTRFREPHG